jgi:TRAP transporter 4TM/12TM fusion protein
MGQSTTVGSDVTAEPPGSEAVVARRAPAVPANDEGGELELGRSHGRLSQIAGYLAQGLGIFHLWTGFSGGLPSLQQRSVHLAVAMTVLTLSIVARRKGRSAVAGRVLGFLSIALLLTLFAYTFFNDERILREFRIFPVPLLILAGLVVVIGLELTRRMIGLVLPAIVVLVGAAIVLPTVVPLPWSDWIAPVAFTDMINSLGFKNNGILGSITGVSAGIIASFLVLGGLLTASGGARAFLNLARFLVGRYRGGPGKVSVITSAFFGTVSGSAIANVVVDGVFNIPLMKRSGFRPSFAAAVEATTSSGGQLVPPVMGAAAFIMAELLGIPYSTVILAAIVPVILYYVGVFVAIHIEAMKQGLPGIPKDQIPKARELITLEFLGSFVIPIGMLLVMLYVFDRSLLFASFVASACVIVYMLLGIREPFAKRLRRVVDGLQRGGEDIARIVAIVFAAQILISLLSMSGIASRVANELAGGGIPVSLSLAFLAVVVIVLGMGVPTAAAYVLAASIATPIFFSLGIPILAGHMFILYLTVYANITPPVMPATYAAAAIARADVMKAGLEGTRLLLPVLIVPFAFALEPSMLLGENATFTGVAWGMVRMLIGMTLLAAGLAFWFLRPLRKWQGILLAVGAALFAWPGTMTTLIGTVLVLPVVVPAVLTARRQRADPALRGAGVRRVSAEGVVSDLRGDHWRERVSRVRAALAQPSSGGQPVGPGHGLAVACELSETSLAALIAARELGAPTVLVSPGRRPLDAGHLEGVAVVLAPEATEFAESGTAVLTTTDLERAAAAVPVIAAAPAKEGQHLRAVPADPDGRSSSWDYDEVQWEAVLRAASQAFQVVSTDRVLVCGDDLHRDHVSLLVPLAALGAGGLVLLHDTSDGFDPARWLEHVAEGEVTAALLSNERLREVVDHVSAADAEVAHGLSAVIHGGREPADEALIQGAIDVFGPILIQYYVPGDPLLGTVVTSEEWLEFDHSIGKAITPESGVVIIGDDGSILGPDREGALVFRRCAEGEAGPATGEDLDGEQVVGTGRRGWVDREGYVHLAESAVVTIAAPATGAPSPSTA